MRDQINYELRNLKLPEDFRQTILHRDAKPRKKTGWYAAAVLLFCVVSSTTVWAGYTFYNSIYVNETKLPPLQPMEKKTVSKLLVTPDELGDYTKDYTDYQDLCEELGIALLDSDLSKDNPYMRITRKTDNCHWNEIIITDYMIGDIPKLTKVDANKGSYYTFQPGKVYGSPVDLSITILHTEEQLASYSFDYLGYFEYVETYHSKQGYRVNLIQEAAGEDICDRDSEFKPGCRAVFVADGIQYRLTGHVTIDTMKEIVDSLHY